MIPFDEAYGIVMKEARCLDAERVDLAQTLGRVLAEDVKSDMDMPPFDKSVMDGYACRRSDLGNELLVVETIAAGARPAKSIRQNECAKIMTGAMVPDGADCVIMVEDTRQTGENTIKFMEEKTSNNICRKGEDIRDGAIVLRKGVRIEPQHIGVLATVGCSKPLVVRRPKVGIIATGNELVESATKPGVSQIRNSNSIQLCAQVKSVGALPKYYGISPDTVDGIDSAVRKAASDCDVILLSGGVSMGDLDLVPGVLKQNGIRLLFERVAVKPGKPTVFGVAEKFFCFGLPGNPVSAFVIFEIMVKPFLFKMMGHDFQPTVMKMRLERDISRKNADRDLWQPVRRTAAGGVASVEYHGSAHQTALCEADGLVLIPRGALEIAEGTIVDVRSFR